MPYALAAAGPAVTLAFTVDELLALLADDAPLVTGLVATMLGRAGAAAAIIEASVAADRLASFAVDGVAPGEKLVALEYVPPFAGVTADDARALAGIARSVPLEIGSQLFAATETPGIWIVLSGQIALDDADGGRLVASSGDVVGVVATLAGWPLERTGRVLSDGVALRIGRTNLVDLWAERPALLRQLLANTLPALRGQPASTWNPAPARAAALTV
jgi:hypothetical protein